MGEGELRGKDRGAILGVSGERNSRPEGVCATL